MNIVKEKGQVFASPSTDYRTTKRAMPMVLDEDHDWKSHSDNPRVGIENPAHKVHRANELRSEELMGVDKPFMKRPNFEEHELDPDIARKQYSPTGEMLEHAHDGGLHEDVTKDAHT